MGEKSYLHIIPYIINQPQKKLRKAKLDMMKTINEDGLIEDAAQIGCQTAQPNKPTDAGKPALDGGK